MSIFLIVQMDMTFLTEVSVKFMNISFTDNSEQLLGYQENNRVTLFPHAYMYISDHSMEQNFFPLVENGLCPINVQGM